MTAQQTKPVPAAHAPRGWRLWLGVPLGSAALRLLGMTWRVEFRNDVAWRKRHDAGTGSILALWHGQLLPLAYALRGQGIQVLVSDHRDGEVISRLLHWMGNGTIRGSTTRGGARALVAMVRALKAGLTVAVTPDGPRGPARKFAPGALVAAQRAGVPIVPIQATVNRAWTLRTWDSFIIPKPFAHIVVNLGEPALVSGTTPAQAELEAPRFEALLAPRDGQ